MRQKVEELQGGYWVAAANSHGIGTTSFDQYTLWHIDDREITTLYVNFKTAKGPIRELIDETRKIIDTWNIEIVFTLQDGHGTDTKSVFPLIHFIHHAFSYLSYLDIRENDQILHLGENFELVRPLLIKFNQKLIDDAMSNGDRSIDPLLDCTIDATMLRNFAQTWNRIGITADPQTRSTTRILPFTSSAYLSQFSNRFTLEKMFVITPNYDLIQTPLLLLSINCCLFSRIHRIHWTFGRATRIVYDICCPCTKKDSASFHFCPSNL